MANISTPNQATRAQEPDIRLPSGALFGAVACAGVVVAGGWFLATAEGGGDGGSTSVALSSGLVGVLMVTIVALLGVAIMTPWKTRPVSDWMTMWLGGTVFRMLVTLALAFLMISTNVISVAREPFGLGLAIGYLATLFAEVAVLAVVARKALPA